MTGQLLIFVLAGVLGGAVNGAAGGAKLFVFPMLLASGLPPIAANVTQGVALWPAQLPAIWVYRRDLLADLRTLARQLLPALAAALAGALIMVNTDDEAFVGIVPLLLAIAVLAIILGDRAGALLRAALPARGLGLVTVALLAAIGFYGGYFGAGMGFMLLAVLSASSGFGIGQVNGAKNLFSFAIQTVAVVPMALSGLVDWVAAVCVLIGGILGGYVGAVLTKRLPETVVRYGVAALGIALTLAFLQAR